MEQRKRLVLRKRMDHIESRRMIVLGHLLLRIQRLHRMQYCVAFWVVAAVEHVDMVEVCVGMDVGVGVVVVDELEIVVGS